MTFVNRAITKLKRIKRRREFRSIHRKMSRYTMIPEEVYIDNLELLDRHRNTVASGPIVECGTWRGGMLGGIGMLIGPECRYIGADSFQGLPSVTENDGKAAKDWQNNRDADQFLDNCKAERSEFDAAMRTAGIRQYDVLQGWFEDTLPTARFDSGIAVLRLDGDWFESTMTCLNSLFDKVRVGGLVIIDDYAAWDGCSRAVHKFLGDRSATEKLRVWNGRVYYIIKEA